MTEEAGDQAPQPVVTLVEWNAPRMSLEEARALAAGTTDQLAATPGLFDLRFFGDFDTGVHYYVLTWESREAMEAYMQSASMLQIRDLAAPYVEGRPSRRIMTDYSPGRRERQAAG